MSSSLLPFYSQYPSAYDPLTGRPGSAGASRIGAASAIQTAPSTSANPADTVDIRSGSQQGSMFTAAAGDKFSLSGLYKGTAAAGVTIAGYRVAVRSDQAAPGDGRLLLNSVDVTGRTGFTADEFSRLQFVAGPSGSHQDLVVVAQTGKRAADGTLSGVTDSAAVQITAQITGTRSLNAASALQAPADQNDASFLGVAREAAVYTGFGTAARPSLTTVGVLDRPQTPVDELSGLVGAFQSNGALVAAEASLATTTSASDVQSLYPDAVGNSRTSSTSAAGQNREQALAAWLLGVTEIGGFQTAGIDLARLGVAVAAYQASPASATTTAATS